MEAEMLTTPTPTVRSAVTVSRPKATPVVAPRTTIATAAQRELPTAPRSDTQSQAPEPAPLQCALCRRRHRLPHCGIFKGMTPQQRQQVAQAHGHCLNCLAPSHLTCECTTGFVWVTITRCSTAIPDPTLNVVTPLAAVLPADDSRDRNREGKPSLRRSPAPDTIITIPPRIGGAILGRKPVVRQASATL
uniref:Uncharacterized protein n=1 Tax=Bactrocera dorsalis TaxID=27457 RepID=A0A034W3L6_BACDO